MSRPLSDVIAATVTDLVHAGGKGGHVHFDAPEFEGLVPEFENPAWKDLAKDIVAIAGRFSNRILVDVPLGSWTEPPSGREIEEVRSLDPWERPGIYLVPEAGSAFEHRKERGWYSDAAPQVKGAHGWWGGYLDLDSPTGPVWRISLLYETKGQ